MKTCTKCNTYKPYCEFNRSSARKDGYSCECKSCKKIHYELTKDKHHNTCKQYYIKNKKTIQKRHINYNNERLKKDKKFRIMFNARARVNTFIRNKEKFSKSIGCSFSVFKLHIEAQFRDGMSWENYGKWHIDHRYPLSVAHKEGPESFTKACNYMNLQPLWASENCKKGNSVI